MKKIAPKKKNGLTSLGWTDGVKGLDSIMKRCCLGTTKHISFLFVIMSKSKLKKVPGTDRGKAVASIYTTHWFIGALPHLTVSRSGND